MFKKTEENQAKTCAFTWCKNPLGPLPVADHYCSHTCLMFARTIGKKKNERQNTTYKPEYAREKFFEYLRECEYTHFPVLIEENKQQVPVRQLSMPSFEGYATFLGVNIRVLRRWAEYDEEFYLAMVKLKEIQKIYLMNNGLSGKYHHTITKMLLMNFHGMAERSESENRNTNLIGIVRDVYALADQQQAKMALDAPLGADKDDEQDVI